MEKYWTNIVKKLIPELTRDTCYWISTFLNISDIYILIDILKIPTCWPINILGVSYFYDNVELLKLCMSKGLTPSIFFNKEGMFNPNNKIPYCYGIISDSKINKYLRPLEIATPKFPANHIRKKYKLEEIPSDEMRYIKELTFEEVKQLRPECVALYFHFNPYFYDLEGKDWQWIYDTCKNEKYFSKYIYTPVVTEGAIEALKLKFIFTTNLYMYPNCAIFNEILNKKGEEISYFPEEEFLDFLITNVPLTYENDTIYNCIQNLWVLKRVHTKIKIWKRRCLEVAFAYSCQETIQILHSKGLKTNKSCIIQALYHGNIRALEYEKEFIRKNFEPIDLLKYVFHKHVLTWILYNFPTKPCSFLRNNNLNDDAIAELKNRGFNVSIKTIKTM